MRGALQWSRRLLGLRQLRPTRRRQKHDQRHARRSPEPQQRDPGRGRRISHVRAPDLRAARMLGQRRARPARRRRSEFEPHTGGSRRASPTAPRWPRASEDSCALRTTGRLECWGWDQYGQLGNGTAEYVYAPVEVRGLSNAAEASAGEYDTCALLSAGHIDCWGYGGYGALGDESNETSYTPVEVHGLSDASQVSAGGYHACAVISGGRVDCWGYGVYGQLGNGKEESSDTPVEAEVTEATQVSVGWYHTCAVLSSGHVKCWGYGAEGELGNGSEESSPTPVEVQGVTDALEVSSGWYHSCAVLSNGHVEVLGLQRLRRARQRHRRKPPHAGRSPGCDERHAGGRRCNPHLRVAVHRPCQVLGAWRQRGSSGMATEPAATRRSKSRA